MMIEMIRHSVRVFAWLAVTSLLVTNYVSSSVRPKIAKVASWKLSTPLDAATLPGLLTVAPTAIAPLKGASRSDGRPAWLIDLTKPAIGLARLEDLQAVSLDLPPLLPSKALLTEHWDDVSLSYTIGAWWTFDLSYRSGEENTVSGPTGHPIFGSIPGTVWDVEPTVENFACGFRLNF